MKKLYGYYGGSRAYGLPTNEHSDWDYYSVGTSTKVTPYKIYPNVKIHQKKRTKGLDVERVELCAYFSYLMNGFAFQVESLFVHQSWMDYLDPRFEDLVLNKKNLFIDRGQLIENVTCNIQNFRKKTVADIAKLKDNIERSPTSKKIVEGVGNMYEEYRLKGFYHKDYVHGIRLAASLAYFLKHDIYPYQLQIFDKDAYQACAFLKAYPSNNMTREQADTILDRYLSKIEEVDLSDDEDKFRFDSTHALQTLKKFYP